MKDSSTNIWKASEQKKENGKEKKQYFKKIKLRIFKEIN